MFDKTWVHKGEEIKPNWKAPESGFVFRDDGPLFAKGPNPKHTYHFKAGERLQTFVLYKVSEKSSIKKKIGFLVRQNQKLDDVFYLLGDLDPVVFGTPTDSSVTFGAFLQEVRVKLLEIASTRMSTGPDIILDESEKK